jgi:hypothetical protein
VTVAERALYHQIHPAKLGADLAAELVSLPLYWRGRNRAASVVHLGVPVIASAVVVRRTADLERLRDSRAGRYVAVEMTPAMQALRMAGDAVAVLGARRRSLPLIGLGAAIIAGGWTLGPRSRSRSGGA